MDTREAAERWAREWAEAWRTHDADRVAALYAPDAVFRSHPFREAHRLGALTRPPVISTEAKRRDLAAFG